MLGCAVGWGKGLLLLLLLLGVEVWGSNVFGFEEVGDECEVFCGEVRGVGFSVVAGEVDDAVAGVWILLLEVLEIVAVYQVLLL